MAQLVPRGGAQARPAGHARDGRPRRSRIRTRPRRSILLRRRTQRPRRPRRVTRHLHEADTPVGELRGGVHPRGFEQHERVRQGPGGLRIRPAGRVPHRPGEAEGDEAEGTEERSLGECFRTFTGWFFRYSRSLYLPKEGLHLTDAMNPCKLKRKQAMVAIGGMVVGSSITGHGFPYL